MMKYTVIILCFFYVLIANGQNSIGTHIGVFFSKQDYGETNGGLSNSVAGIEVGVLYKLLIVKNLYIKPNLLFIQKGGDKNFDMGNLSIKSNQLEASALLGYQVGNKNALLFVNLGPYYGRVLSTIIKENPFLSSHQFIFSKQEYGCVLGGGFTYRINKFNLSFFVNYRQSLNEVGKVLFFALPGDPIYSMKIKNHHGIGLGLNWEMYF